MLIGYEVLDEAINGCVYHILRNFLLKRIMGISSLVWRVQDIQTGMNLNFSQGLSNFHGLMVSPLVRVWRVV